MNTDAKKGIKSGLQTGIKNFTIPAIDILVTNKPEWILPWIIVKGFFGVLFDYQQEKINWFVEYLQENQDIFVKEILTTDEFQEGFVITFENYLKQRGENRRKIIEMIFLDYTVAVDKESFELERLYKTSELISVDSIKFLSFINQEVWPNLLIEIKNGKAKDEKLNEILGEFFRKDNHDKKYPDFYKNYIEYMAELNNLGLTAIKGSKTVTYAGETNVLYGFTDFGMKFISYTLNLN